MMRKLYIHCGLAKTGTTSLQDHLHRRQAELRVLGYYYPSIDINLVRNAHHNFALELLGDARFDPSAGTVEDLLSLCGRADRVPNIVISSESFAVALARDGARERFLSFLENARKVNDEVYTLFTFRSFWRRVDSAHFEELKTGRALRPIPVIMENDKRWLTNFFGHMVTLHDALDANRVIALDIETGTQDSISAVLASMGLAEDRLPRRRAKGNLNVRLSLKKSAYLYQLQYEADGTFKKQTAVDIPSVVRASGISHRFRTTHWTIGPFPSNRPMRFRRSRARCFRHFSAKDCGN